jgi:hypothetical protein
MITHQSYSNSIYEEQTHLADAELSAFVAEVRNSYGPEQARLSTDDWLNESDLIDSAPRSEPRDWRAVTVAAWAKLALRVHQVQIQPISSTKAKDRHRT